MISILSLDYRSVQFFKAEILHHFGRLSPEDIYYRFGRQLSPARVSEIVEEQLDDPRNYWYVADDPDRYWWQEGAVVGVLQIAVLANRTDAEVGVSLLPEYRDQGIGTRLLDKAKAEAPILGVQSLFVHMVSGNTRMRNLAANAGIAVEYIGSGESEGRCDIQTKNPTGSDLWFYYTSQLLNQTSSSMRAQLKRWVESFKTDIS